MLLFIFHYIRYDWSKTTAYVEYKDKNGKIIREPIKITIKQTP